MDLLHIERLASVQEDVVRKTENDIKLLEKYADEYRALKEQLSTLPDRLSYDIMVPFGSVAFMPGKLVHTNEIRVLLGDDWFVDRSAKQAVEIIDRRLKIVDDDVSGLKKHRDLFKPHLDFTKEFREQAQQEAQIAEEYNEEEEKAWRAQHRLNVKRFYEEQKAARDAEKHKDEEEYWRKMEEAEEREDEGFDAMSSTTPKSAHPSNSETDPEGSHETRPSKTISDNTQTKPSPDDTGGRPIGESAAKKSAGKSVRWQDIVQSESTEEQMSSDDSEEYVELCRPTTIHFVHTTVANDTSQPAENSTEGSVVQGSSPSKWSAVQGSSSTEGSAVQGSGGSTSESCVRRILSPADICSFHVSTAPKSILKKRLNAEEKSQQSSTTVTRKASPIRSSQSSQKPSSHSRTLHEVIPTPVRQPLHHPSTTFPVMKVIERDTSSSNLPKKSPDSTVISSADAPLNDDGNKRVSKFKASRSKKTPN